MKALDAYVDVDHNIILPIADISLSSGYTYSLCTPGLHLCLHFITPNSGYCSVQIGLAQATQAETIYDHFFYLCHKILGIILWMQFRFKQWLLVRFDGTIIFFKEETLRPKWQQRARLGGTGLSICNYFNKLLY